MYDCVYRWERESKKRYEGDEDYSTEWFEVLIISEAWAENKVDEADSCWNAEIEESLLDYTIDYWYDETKNDWTHEEMTYISLKPALEKAGAREWEAMEESEDAEQRSFPFEDSPQGTVIEFGVDTKAYLNLDTMEWVG